MRNADNTNKIPLWLEAGNTAVFPAQLQAATAGNSTTAPILNAQYHLSRAAFAFSGLFLITTQTSNRVLLPLAAPDPRHCEHFVLVSRPMLIAMSLVFRWPRFKV